MDRSNAQDSDPFSDSLSGEDDPYNSSPDSYIEPEVEPYTPPSAFPSQFDEPRSEIYDDHGRRVGTAVEDDTGRILLYDNHGRRIGNFE